MKQCLAQVKRLTLGVLLAGLSSVLWADGLPFNKARTGLDTDVVVLKLNPSQRLQVSRTRMLTLTKAQRTGLLRRAKGCPTDLQVLTNRYDDCTCQMASIAVWFKPGEVVIPISYLPESPMTQEELDDMGGPPAPVDLAIDEHLRLWIKGRAVTETEFRSVLLKWQQDPAERRRLNEKGQLSIYLDTPPKTPEVNESGLRRLISRIRSFSSEHDIDLFVSGFRAIGQ